jgi:hypothetical protein
VTDATYGEADAALSDTETRDEEAANALVPQAMGRFRAASKRPRTSLRRATPRLRFAPTNRIWRAFEKWCDNTNPRSNFRSWQTIDHTQQHQGSRMCGCVMLMTSLQRVRWWASSYSSIACIDERASDLDEPIHRVATCDGMR